MSHKNKLIMVITMLFGGFFGLLNETLLTTALPSIMKGFKIEYTQVQWLTTAFLLMNGIVIPLSAMIIQRYTTRQVFMSAIAIFFIGTIIADCSFNRKNSSSHGLRDYDAVNDDNNIRCI
jgi:DHA2 family multidrug resistance protein-like MFS transporter